jgi:hypothetical protein
MERVERTLSRNPVKNESIVEIGLKWLMENDVLAAQGGRQSADLLFSSMVLRGFEFLKGGVSG